MNKKRLVSFILTASLMLGLFSGCKKNASADGKDAAASGQSTSANGVAESKYAYKASYTPVELPDGLKINYINSLCLCEDSLVFAANYVTGTEKPLDPETGEPVLDENTGKPLEYEVYDTGLFRMDFNTCEVTTLNGYEAAEIPEGYEGDSYIANIVSGSDDTFWTMEETNTYYFDLPEGYDEANPQEDMWNYYMEGERFTSINQYSSQGGKLHSAVLQLPENGYVSELKADSNGYFYTTDWMSVFVFDKNGSLVHTVACDQGVNELVQIAPDQVGITAWSQDYEKLFLKIIDPVSGEFSKEIELINQAYSVYPGIEGYQYLYVENDNVYGYTEGAESPEKLLNWMDCDLNSNNVNDFVFLQDGRIAALENIWTNDRNGHEYNLVMLERVDPSTLPKKNTLTLACLGLDWNIRTMIVNFNRSSDTVRIAVKDYLDYMEDGTYEDVIQKLNTEILSGHIPDLLCLSGLPVAQYASKGILMDLWPLIDSDPDVGRDDLMSHVFDVMSVDGKLYQITNTFSIQTTSVDASIAAGRTSWTLEDVLDAMTYLQPDATIFGESDTKTGIMNQCISSDLDSYIDWETGQCNFDSPEFISILNFTNSFPEDFDWESYDWELAESEHSRLKNKKQLMAQCYISSLQDLQVQPALHGTDITYIGFPSENGKGHSFQLGTTISISSSCKDVDGAWSFVRQLLMEENQMGNDVWGLPTNKNAFDARVEEAMTPVYYTDPETGEQVEQSQGGIGYGNDFSIDLYAIKQEHMDAFEEVYENCNAIYSYDDALMTIIAEECGPFFAGQKSAEETAGLIQNRIGLYVAERK